MANIAVSDADLLHRVRRLNTNRDAPIWLMEDPRGRQIAVKTMPTSLLSFRTRSLFLQRIEIIRKLNHPALAPVYYGTTKLLGQCTQGMAYVAKGSLLDALSPGDQRIWTLPMPTGTAIKLLLEIFEGVAVLHSRDILHGGLKPGNILLTTGSDTLLHPLISDIALHQGIDGTFPFAEQRPVGLGDPFLYMAPEQYHKDPVLASDRYALGVIAFLLLTGESPYTIDPLAVLQATRPIKARLLSSVNPMIPTELDEVIAKALEPSPRARFRSLREFALALRGASQLKESSRSISIVRGSIPHARGGQPSIPEGQDIQAHEVIQFPEPLAIMGADQIAGMPELPQSYGWTPEALSLLPAPQTKVQPELQPITKTQSPRDIQGIVLRISIAAVSVAIVIVLILLIITIVVRTA